MIDETQFKNKTIFSFEAFPPKKTMPIDTIFSTLDELKGLSPDFISVTFGAGGSENCNNSVEIAKHIKNVCNVESVIHMPALNMTKADAQFVLEQFQQAGINNMLALRGDKVEGKEPANEFPLLKNLTQNAQTVRSLRFLVPAIRNFTPSQKMFLKILITLKRKLMQAQVICFHSYFLITPNSTAFLNAAR